ncbi:ABC transporter substrate-binding protein [Pseudomonas sp. AF32]|uniref:ABC transporter substrate-binding protein n=1 Tax=Pseudomonas sp. AF32 TaxID=554390 RepID=UPI001EEDA481|nr:ABC transporter substrate-binding protein [Pseudomonas sp. AF32]MCG6574066.1 ABC transporter substrate-binding protein [Pseudomonas sp. AF32]
MNLWPKRLTRLLCVTVALCAMQVPVSLAQGETPPDQLVVGMSMINLLSLDPAAATGLEVAEVNANVYDMLLEQDAAQPDMLIPALAKTWEISPDRLRLTFQLRDDVRFHSGAPLTAQDVAWSLQRVVTLNRALASTWKAYGFTADNVVKLMRAEGPHTFVMELPRVTDPMLVLNTLATSPSAFIIDRSVALQHQVADDQGAAWLATHAAGSGAFKLDIWRANDVILMSRNDDYWRGAAKLRRVIMRNMTESQALRLMVERGDLDVARGMAATDIKALGKVDEVRIQSIARGTLYYVAMSMQQPLFQDIRVRQAIRLLIDYQGINEVVMPHYGVLNQRPLQLGLAARLPDPGYRLDVAEAKRLLAAAGHGDGFKISIRSLTDPPFINIATSLQATLAQAGIQATIITGTGNQIYGAMRDRQFDILVGRGGGGAERHPHSSLRALVYNPDNRTEAKLSNFQGWRTSFFDPQLNQLIEQAERERDPERQRELYGQIQNRYDQQAGAIMPVSQMVDEVVTHADVRNYIGHTAATTRLRDVYKQR